MPEIMVRFDDLRRYCEKHHCGSVPLEYIKQMPTIHDIDRAAILRLCNEIEDIACDISNQTMNDVVYAEARMIFDKVKAIRKELTGDAGSKID